MSLYNNQVFPGITDELIIHTPYYATWNEALISPPGTEYIRTENNIILAAENLDKFVTE
jgi:hypothetical protein